MTPAEELNSIYVRIGNDEPITDELSERIELLENIVNPKVVYRCEPVESVEPEGCGCDHPRYCWECAAIRGGCPEDA
jgi:hypothetical protein